MSPKQQLYVIGPLGLLPDGPRTAVQARHTDDPREAGAAVAVCPADGQWPHPLWDQLREVFQDYGLAVYGVWIDPEGCSRKPNKPWPGSMWAHAETRHHLVWYRLCRDPDGYDSGDATILFPNSEHKGKSIREVPVSYLDWLVAQEWLDPASFFGRMARLYLGRLARGHLEHLSEEPYTSRGFNPMDALPGDWVKTYQGPATYNGKRPSGWSQRRPRAQTEAEDEAINQDLGRKTAQLPPERSGTGPPPPDAVAPDAIAREEHPAPEVGARLGRVDGESSHRRPLTSPSPAGSPAEGGCELPAPSGSAWDEPCRQGVARPAGQQRSQAAAPGLQSYPGPGQVAGELVGVQTVTRRAKYHHSRRSPSQRTAV
jgi:hypothetical protein